ncbi:MAG: FmdB family zinc ribbon protein, partial [Actinomycetota bacterium]
MPTYEYACKQCGHTFEIVQSFKDDTLTVCPECGGELRKVFTPPAITFKGSGFYATDHGKKSKSPGSCGKTEKKEPSKAS